MKRNNSYRKCSQCGDLVAHWYLEDCHHHYYCEHCFPSVRGSDNIRNLDDWGEPLVGSNVMWWSSSSVSSDFHIDGSLVRKSDSFYYTYLDDENNRMTTNRFVHSPSGFLISSSEKLLLVSYNDLLSIFNSCSLKYLNSSEIFKLKNVLGESFFRYRFGLNRSFVEYNKVMSDLGNYIRLFSHSMFNTDNHIQNFFKSYRSELKKYCFIGGNLK